MMATRVIIPDGLIGARKSGAPMNNADPTPRPPLARILNHFFWKCICRYGKGAKQSPMRRMVSQAIFWLCNIHKNNNPTAIPLYIETQPKQNGCFMMRIM